MRAILNFSKITLEHLLTGDVSASNFPCELTMIKFSKTFNTLYICFPSNYKNLKRVDTDNGLPFTSSEWKQHLKWKGIEHHHITHITLQAIAAETIMASFKKVIQTSEFMS